MGPHRGRDARCALVGAAAMLMAVSACGSGDDGSADAAPATTTKAVPCHGNPVVLGTITSLSGPEPLPDIMGGVKAAAKAVNHKCTAGRPVNLVTCDDSGQPSQGADCGRKIVRSKAVALVGSGGVASASFEPIVQKAGIPSFGNLGGDPTELLAPTSFPFYHALTRASARAALTHAAGARTVSVIIPDNPTPVSSDYTCNLNQHEYSIMIKLKSRLQNTRYHCTLLIIMPLKQDLVLDV